MVLGLTVFVHPTAPLYALTAYAAAVVLVPRSPRSVIRETWPGALALLVAFVPYYLRTLHVLGDRYGVGTAKAGGRTFTGRPVWDDAIHFLAPGRAVLNFFTALAVVGIVALIVRKDSRVVAFCAITIAAPILFFSLVPANGDSALFFDRYMIPATPAFLVLVVAGARAIGSWAGGGRLLVIAILVAGLAGIELRYVDHRREQQQGIGLDAVTNAVASSPHRSVLFGSTGTSGAFFSSFDYGHPANLLDHYLSLRLDSVQLVDDDSCARALPYVTGLADAASGRVGLLCSLARRGCRRAHRLALARRHGAGGARPLLRRPLAHATRTARSDQGRAVAAARVAWRRAVEQARERAAAG